MGRQNRFRRITVVAATVIVGLITMAVPASATPPASWSSYLYGPTHSSYNSLATAITTSNAGSLTHDWTWTPPAPTQAGQPAVLLASPTVLNGVVYIGAGTGIFYALNSGNGKVIWSQNLGYTTSATCGALGIVSSATVTDNSSGVLTVYVAGGSGYLYALNAATGAIEWQTEIALPTATQDYYNWSSPLVVGGNIYIGQSSECSDPEINGGEKEFNQTTGALENFWETNPGHTTGASIWSSAAYDSNGLFVTTGNGPNGAAGNSVSIVRLNPATLAQEDNWQIPAADHPADSDFGGSPTLFTATIDGVSTPMVGACNKNGVYYALDQNDLAAGPVWQNAIGVSYVHHSVSECDAAAVWNGSDLFEAGNGATIDGTTYGGDLEEIDPATGDPIWQIGLAGPPIGSPSLDGSGVIAVTEYGIGAASKSYVVTLVNAATGAVLATIPTGPDFGQPVFAGPRIFIPTENRGLQVYSG
jgi:outer membrane protein assembly factor BamB